jgi:hypothetical protein
MPLTHLEIAVGAIIYVDVQILHADPLVQITGDPVTRITSGNQFVCYCIKGEESYWTPLTGTTNPVRLKIRPNWVSNGYGPLQVGKVWLQDGKNTYRGPNTSFIAAAINELPFATSRPSISTVGIGQILRAIRKRGGAQ